MKREKNMQKFYGGYFRRILSTAVALLLTITVWGGSKELKVLQLNTWINGTIVSGGVEGLVDVIDQTKPDVVFLCELDAGSDNPLSQRVVDALDKRGQTWYGDGKNSQTCILSKYPLSKISVLQPTKEWHRTIMKACINVNGRTVALYSAHLDHMHYAPYLPKGYGASIWKKIDVPVCDPDSILAANRVSLRDEAIRGFIRDAKTEADRGALVVFGGDFNEPSHTDWQADTKDIRDHGGDLVNISGGVTIFNQTMEQISKGLADSAYFIFRQTVEQSGIPYFPAIGNHDRYYNDLDGYKDGDELFCKHFGTPSYYTFERKGVRFFVLNSVQDGLSIGKAQMAWLKRELIRVPLATPIVVVQHVPVYSQYFPAIEGKFGPWDITGNYREELDAFREYNLKLVLQGHQHIYEEIFVQNVQFITGGSVCASWWSGPFHGTEEGFLLVRFKQPDTFQWEYVDYGWNAKNRK